MLCAVVQCFANVVIVVICRRSARVQSARYNARCYAESRAAPQESSSRVSTFRFYSLIGRSAAPLRVKFVALRCARRRVRGALSRGVHHRAFDCASPHRTAPHRGLSIYLPACSACDTREIPRADEVKCLFFVFQLNSVSFFISITAFIFFIFCFLQNVSI